jgi:adenosine deaminase
VRRGLSKIPGIEISLIADLVRDYGPEHELITLNKLKEVISEGVIGIGIGGSEQSFPPGPFESLFKEARRMGFRVTAHAGEAAGPESVWSAIRSLHPDRIGHGTRAYEDPCLVDFLKENRIAVEACPISNLRTGIVSSLKDHPIREYFERGLLVSVNTDDPMMFNTALDREYESLVQHCRFTKKDICQLILLGIKSSWMPEVRKEQLAAEFIRDPSWIGGE